MSDTGTPQLVTIKVGSLGWWHAVHIVGTLLTLRAGAWWLIVYVVHAIVSAITRPTVTLEVPAGSRIEYYRGYPQVLASDEYLERDPRRIWTRNILIGIVVLAGIVLAGLIAFDL